MKKIAIIMIFVVIFLLSGCMPDEYTFPNKEQAVEKIEMLYNPSFYSLDMDEPMELICTLEGKNADAFLEGLYSLNTNKCITPPPTHYGAYVARTIYLNGDVEMFGSYHIEFIAKGDSPMRVGAYYFSFDAFEELFCEYTGMTSFEEDLTRRRGTVKTGDGSLS